MHAQKECRQCLKNLVLMTLTLASTEKYLPENERGLIRKELLLMLNRQFNSASVPANIFTGLNRQIKKLTGAKNPFKERKDKEMADAQSLASRMLREPPRTLKDMLLFSAAGNSFDFFKDIGHSLNDIQGAIRLEIDHSEEFKQRLGKSKRILFFADNAGECFFDIPLVNLLRRKSKVLYAVKSSPVQNDLTLTDIKNMRFRNKPDIITTGNDAVGIELETSSKRLKHELDKCDLLIAKGMGYYETFTELPHLRKKTFHLLMAKCRPVAKSLGVKLNSYVFINMSHL